MGANDPGENVRRVVRISPLLAAVLSGIVFAGVVVVLWYSPKALVAVSAGVGYAWLTWAGHHLIRKRGPNGQ